MKKFFLLLMTIFFVNALSSQVPDLTWSKVMGGSDIEAHGTSGIISRFFGRWVAIDVGQNNQIYIATTSRSNNGFVSGNHGEEDVWVVSLNNSGDTLWTKVFGGSTSERALQIRALSDGGCIVVGHSYSRDGAFVTNSETGSNGYLARLDNAGNIVWFRMYGGTNFDYLYDIIETSDGYLMACGEAYSEDGDLLNAGDGMNWLLKVNPANGNIIWSKTIPGPDAPSNDRFENVFRLNEITPGNIILTGYTTPDFLNFMLDRISVISVDLNGTALWTKKIGGAGAGDYAAGVVPGENGDFYVLGKINTNVGGAGDASNFYGGNGDFWLVKMNNQGTILWNKNYGGTNSDIPYDMKRDSNGNLYLVGYTASNNNDATHSIFGQNDMWLLKVNAQGDTIYTKRFGGSSDDFASGIAFSQNENTFFISGATESNNGTFSGLYGARDIVVLRMDYEAIPNEYQLTIQVNGQGATNPAVGSYMYEEGEQIPLQANPSAGWYFVNWTDALGTVISENTNFSFNMPSNNVTITANFQILTHEILASSGANGNIQPSGVIQVQQGNSQMFTITPNTGYEIANVLVDGISVGAVGQYTFQNVTGNHTIHATFSQIIVNYTITASAGANGNISPNGQVIVQQGNSQMFTITPNTGYEIADVLVDGISVGAVGQYTFQNVTGNHTIHATFSQIIVNYTITASADANGNISPNGQVIVQQGNSQMFTITPNTGYEIANVLVDGISVGAVGQYTFQNVTGNHTIHATFSQIIVNYTITASAGANGSISPNGQVIVQQGNSQMFTITPNTGYEIANVLVDGISVGAVGQYTFQNVTGNHTIHASFTQIFANYIINATAGLNGNISPDGEILVEGGSNQSFAIFANTGYEIADVLVDGVSIGVVTNYTFQNINSNHTIHATFSQISTNYTITATAGPNGMISPAGEIQILQGGFQEFHIIPNNGYFIDDVFVDGESIGPFGQYIFANVSSNHTIHAIFGASTYMVFLNADPEGWGSVFGDGAYGFGEEVTITAIPEEGYIFVHWKNGEDIFSTEALHTFSMPGMDLELTAIFDNDVSVNDISEELTISVFPNPAMTEARIQANKTIQHISVYDIQGKIIENNTVQNTEFTINVGDYPKGLYFIQIQIDNIKTIRKLMVN